VGARPPRAGHAPAPRLRLDLSARARGRVPPSRLANGIVAAMSEVATRLDAPLARAPADKPLRPPTYWPFVIPALVVVLAVIVFPWAFTLWMSVNEWKVGSEPAFVGLSNYARLPTDPRFLEAVWQTLLYTVLSVVLPLVLGTLAACVFHARFPLRGFLRGVFILPMMATPVAIALVWTMMFHPQLGVLNYLLSLVGIPAQLWVFSPNTVIPSLVMVETWQWTPLVMLIVLGGLAAIPSEPYESAVIDGANAWQIFWKITLPLITPFLFVAAMIRMIDAVKSFDIIFAITQGGPGTASETINIYLYNVAFAYYDVGYGSAIAVVFFALIVALAAALLAVRKRTAGAVA
jgi:multiple sugar transport system permease protein